MSEGKAIVLFWSKNGNTEEVARRIHDTLKKAGMKVSISEIKPDEKASPAPVASTTLSIKLH